MKKTLVFAALLCSMQLSAQLTLEQTVYGGKEFYNYYPTPARTFFCEQSGECIQFVDGEYKNGATVVTSSSNLQKAVPQAVIEQWLTPQSLWCSADSVFYRLDIQNGKATVSDSIVCLNGQAFDFNFQAGNVAYRVGDNLFVSNASKTVRVNSEDGGNGIVFGSSVHRDEFGINGGTFWSPSGKQLCFYRLDESMVAEYPIVDITARQALAKPIRYPMAGETSHQVSVGVFNVQTQQTVWLKTESPVDRYFTNIAWSADEKFICMAEINRDQNHMWFNVYNSATGQLEKTLFEEQDNEWVEPCTPAVFVDADQFIWLSERNGFRHIYLYSISSGKCKQLTNGNWTVCELYGYNKATGKVVFQANKRGYIYADIFAVDLKGRVTQISDDAEIGIHRARFSANSSAWVDLFQSQTVANRTTLRNLKAIGQKPTTNSKVTKVLSEVVNPYQGLTIPKVSLVEGLTSADGKFPLYGMMITPPDFDSTKQYPVIIYVYAGPHNQMVNAGWLCGSGPWELYLAQQGYIVFSMDNRGCENGGREFEHCIHRQLGKCETEDQMQGVKYLKSLPFVDSTRIGVHGWSFGGFMTINMLCEHPNEFKAGVAGGPVCDWSLYEVMYGERYMDTPQQNPEGYKNSTVCNKIGNLKSRLLVIHGDIDPVVVWQHSLKLLQRAVDQNVMIDYAVYPQHEHNVLGHDRVHLIDRIVRYFNDNLK